MFIKFKTSIIVCVNVGEVFLTFQKVMEGKTHVETFQEVLFFLSNIFLKYCQTISNFNQKQFTILSSSLLFILIIDLFFYGYSKNGSFGRRMQAKECS